MRGPLALVAAMILIGGCTGQEDRGGFGEAPPPTEADPSPPGASEQEGEEVSEVVRVSALEGFRFEPAGLQIRAGEPVEFVLANRAEQDHTFVVSELAVVMLAGASQTVRSTVDVDPGNTGRFTYFCSIGDHRERGMTGMITVT